MTSILCLAHYCDLHGPTPLMVTEGHPVPCTACYDEGILDFTRTPDDGSNTTTPPSGMPRHTATAISEAFRRMSIGTAPRSSSVPASEQEAQAYRTALRRVSQVNESGSAIETPPQSPSLPQGPAQQKPRPDSGFRRTYDEYVTRRAGPCDNCALTLPKRQESGKDAGADARQDQGPTLRTRAPCARVFQGADGTASPPPSQSSSSSPSEDESSIRRRPSHHRTGTAVSVVSHSSTSSSTGVNAHTHYLDYTSTHEPVAPASFSIVRASCLRTLSFETLPRPPATGPLGPGSSASTPCASPSTPAFVTTHSLGSATSGGPIFFGDPGTGYTTAYIFRIPDVHARGHKRVYAFLALSTYRERQAMKTFAFVAAAFRDMAAWIQALAEAEAERTLAESSGSTATSPVTAGPGYGSIPSDPIAPISGGSGSSFLMSGAMGGGLSRRMGGGFGGSGVALKQRGLAELVGLPDFFIELHTRFVRLLLELRVVLGS